MERTTQKATGHVEVTERTQSDGSTLSQTELEFGGDDGVDGVDGVGGAGGGGSWVRDKNARCDYVFVRLIGSQVFATWGVTLWI